MIKARETYIVYKDAEDYDMGQISSDKSESPVRAPTGRTNAKDTAKESSKELLK